MKRWAWTFPVLLLAAPAFAGEPSELLPPAQVQAGGRPLDIEREGHAAPFVGDFYGTGNRDLLVGQFGEGILWVYKNVGTNAAPKFAAGVKFKEGTADGRVPTG